MRSQRATSRWAPRAAWLVFCLVGCSQILGFEDGSAQGACSSNEDCVDGFACFVGQCRRGCESDGDCDAEWRCLKGSAESACIPRDQDCGEAGSGCPEGTACVRAVCRTECAGDAECAGEQSCSDAGVCVSDGAREPGGGDAGSGGSPSAGGGGNGGAGGTLGAPGGAGMGPSGDGGDPAVAGSGPQPQGGDAAGGAGGTGVEPPKPCTPLGCSAAKPICDDGTCVAPKSCTVAEICGSPAVSACCGPTEVEGDSFLRDYDDVTHIDDTHPAEISSFYLDALEVTVSRFRLFVNEGMGTQASPPAAGSGALHGRTETGWQAGWNSQLRATKASLVAEIKCSDNYETWTDEPPAGAEKGNENRPINCVTWYEAFAFCAWDGGRLPTEAEWNFAAAGGEQQRVYPWSTPANSPAISASNASYYVDDIAQCQGDGKVGCTGDDIVVAGSKSGQGRYFNFDLSGNLAEWVMDYWSDNYDASCNDCVQLTDSGFRTLRGGASASGALAVTASSRARKGPLVRTADQGIRCAYDVPGTD